MFYARVKHILMLLKQGPTHNSKKNVPNWNPTQSHPLPQKCIFMWILCLVPFIAFHINWKSLPIFMQIEPKKKKKEIRKKRQQRKNPSRTLARELFFVKSRWWVYGCNLYKLIAWKVFWFNLSMANIVVWALKVGLIENLMPPFYFCIMCSIFIICFDNFRCVQVCSICIRHVGYQLAAV